jgi:Flp pilus assembly protein TadG
MAPVTLRERLRSERGAELVEFALCLPLLLIVVLGILDFGFLFQRYEVVTNAAREGARVAVLPGYAAADVTDRVEQYLTAAGLDPAQADLAPVAASAVEIAPGGPCMTVTGVTVGYPHTYSFVGQFMQYFGGPGLTNTMLTATARMRYEGAAMSCS